MNYFHNIVNMEQYKKIVVGIKCLDEIVLYLIPIQK